MHRNREVAVQNMVGSTANQRLTRAMASRARASIALADLKPGDQVDFFRKAATKDESG